MFGDLFKYAPFLTELLSQYVILYSQLKGHETPMQIFAKALEIASETHLYSQQEISQ